MPPLCAPLYHILQSNNYNCDLEFICQGQQKKVERLSLIHDYNQLLLPRQVSAEVREDLLVPSPLTYAYPSLELQGS